MQTDLSGIPGLFEVFGHQNLTGHITLPIGDLDFMTSSSINGAPVYNPYTQYNFADPQSNSFHDPTFVDASKGDSAVLEYRHRDPSIAGHLVIPIFKDAERRNFFNVMEKQGVLETPKEKQDTPDQVTFVRAGERHDILRHTTSNNNKYGFAVATVGTETFNWARYISNKADPDTNKEQTVYD